MMVNFRFDAPKKGHNVILPLVARIAVGLLPLVSALPSVAQTAARENIVAKDTLRPLNSPEYLITLMQATKPTAAKLGDVIAQLQVEHFTDTETCYTNGWKITKIDARGIGLSPTARGQIVTSEHTIDFSKITERVYYGEKKTLNGYPSLTNEHPIFPLAIKAEKGTTPGTVIVTTVFSRPALNEDSDSAADTGGSTYPKTR